jgi:hypothetical protein
VAIFLNFPVYMTLFLGLFVKQLRKATHTRNARYAGYWTGHILGRNRLLKHVTEEKIEEMGRPGRRRKKLLDDFMERG